MSTATRDTPIRIHTHFGRIVINDAPGYLTPAQTEALAKELEDWVYAVSKGFHPATRLVYPDGRRVCEADGDTAFKHI